jgi:hypothetical protein
MINKKLSLVHEQSSALFRLMFIQNSQEPARRQFDNNICAFHIGGGYILSVAHNLRTEAGLFKSIDEAVYQNEIFPRLDTAQRELFNQSFFLDTYTNKRYVNIPNQQDAQNVANILAQVQFDTRWATLLERKICTPYLILHFSNNLFYNDAALTSQLDANNHFPEPALNRHSFLIELELVEAFYGQDVALYKIINTPEAIINRLPSLEVDERICNDDQQDYYCLQSAPGGALGRLLNHAQIEGFLDHHGIFPDRIGGNYIFEGLRYLIKGYFRFGSSGAPYVVYDEASGQYKVNAIQSEASPIQLSIKNDREGNFQYINAIAVPLANVMGRVRELTASKS